MTLRLSERRMEPSPRQSLSALPDTSQSPTVQICYSCFGLRISNERIARGVLTMGIQGDSNVDTVFN